MYILTRSSIFAYPHPYTPLWTLFVCFCERRRSAPGPIKCRSIGSPTEKIFDAQS